MFCFSYKRRLSSTLRKQRVRMPDDYLNLCIDLAAEHAALDALVAPLDELLWSHPTPAEGWTIRDSILHLALTDATAALAACDPAGFEAYRTQRRGGADAFADNRGIPASQLLAVWRANRQHLLDCLHQVSPRARITWFGPPMSAMSHATARLMETWAHGQDIVDALGLERHDTPRLKHIAHLGVRARAYSYQQHNLTPPATDVYVELAAPDNATWTWGETSAADRVQGPAGDFCQVVVRRRHVDDTRLDYAGPHAREWLLIAQAYAGPPGKGRDVSS
jgi:uncharacterized protein (TIGR03084 family)